jgi:glycosyltransferase involved in cell wall biosynthesis
MSDTPNNSLNPHVCKAGCITVIIRTLGRPELGEALASIAAQQLQPAEVLLINAACRPLHAVLQEWSDRLPLKEVCAAKPLNRPEAANAGLLAASSEWLCFLDDDDFQHPDHLSTLMAALKQAPDARAAYSGFLMLDEHDRPHARLNRPYDHAALRRGNYIQMGAALFARSLVEEGARFDESLLNYQDWDFWLQLAERTRFAHTGQATLSWRAFRGQSGSGMGANADLALQARYTRRIREKWAGALKGLSSRAPQPSSTSLQLV